MNARRGDKFVTLWKKYFDDTELPITFYYTNEKDHTAPVEPNSAPRCIIWAAQEGG